MQGLADCPVRLSPSCGPAAQPGFALRTRKDGRHAQSGDPAGLAICGFSVAFVIDVYARHRGLAEAGIEPSVGSKGDSYDNALAETINGLYKAELIHLRATWKTKESLELATLEWVSWFNHHRLLEPIEYIPPPEAEENYNR